MSTEATATILLLYTAEQVSAMLKGRSKFFLNTSSHTIFGVIQSGSSSDIFPYFYGNTSPTSNRNFNLYLLIPTYPVLMMVMKAVAI